MFDTTRFWFSTPILVSAGIIEHCVQLPLPETYISVSTAAVVCQWDKFQTISYIRSFKLGLQTKTGSKHQGKRQKLFGKRQKLSRRQRENHHNYDEEL